MVAAASRSLQPPPSFVEGTAAVDTGDNRAVASMIKTEIEALKQRIVAEQLSLEALRRREDRPSATMRAAATTIRERPRRPFRAAVVARGEDGVSLDSSMSRVDAHAALRHPPLVFVTALVRGLELGMWQCKRRRCDDGEPTAVRRLPLGNAEEPPPATDQWIVTTSARPSTAATTTTMKAHASPTKNASVTLTLQNAPRRGGASKPHIPCWRPSRPMSSPAWEWSAAEHASRWKGSHFPVRRAY